MELPCSPEAVHEDFKIMIPKRNTDPDTESGDSQDEIDEILSQVSRGSVDNIRITLCFLFSGSFEEAGAYDEGSLQYAARDQ